MIKVECTSCKNPYELDEKRLPQSGLRMRCPKCGASFLVFPDGRSQPAPAVSLPVAPAAPGGAFASMPRPGVPKPPMPAPGAKPVVKPPVPKPALDEEIDLPGVPAPKPIGGAFADDLDLPAPAGAKKPAAPAAKPSFADDLDLPAPAGAKKPAAPAAKPSFADDLDLPAPAGAKRPAAPAAKPSFADDLDLPAPAGAKKPPPPKPSFGDDLDLPANRPPSGIDLPAVRRTPSLLDDDLDLPAAPPSRDVDLPAAKGRPRADELDLPAPSPPKRPTGAGAAKSMDDGLDLPARPKPKTAAGLGSLDADLPAPRGKPAVPDLDLPAPRGKAPDLDLTPRKSADLDLELPTPRSAKPADLELDLPAPRGKGGLDLDLPAPRGKSALAGGANPFDDLDGPSGLELDLPTPRKTPGDLLDLPTPRKTPGGDLLDLPTPRKTPGGDLLDLPAPRGELADLPAPAGAVDLPQPSFGGLDLPVPRGASDLPTVRGAVDLPTARGAVDLPTARGVSDLPIGRGALDLPKPGVPKTTRERAAFDLPVPGAGPSLPPDAFGSAPRTSMPAQASAEAALGDLELPLPEGPRPSGPVAARLHGEVDLPGSDGTEFAGLPVERTSAPPISAPKAVAAAVKPAARPVPTAPAPAPGRARRNGILAAGAVVLLGAAGGALTFTPYGPFGYYIAEQFLPGAGDAAAVRRVIDEADRLALLDSYQASNDALTTLAEARHDAGLNRELLARSLLHESLHIVRWEDAVGSGRAAAIRQRLQERGTDDPAIALALAADELRAGHEDRTLRLISRARAFAPTDPLVDMVEAEAALASGDAATALQAFQQALEHGGGARAQWGIARALENGGDADAIRTAVDATLILSPRHGDALLARARLAHGRGNDELAMPDIRAVVGLDPVGDAPIVSPPHLRGAAYALAGTIHEGAGRLHQALESYAAATDADPTRTDALLGAGRVLLVDRPAEALTRFESVIERADAAETVLASGRTAAQDARLGAARAMLDLERDEEAKAVLENLVTERPEDPEFHLWLGRARASRGENESAVEAYREAIRLAPTELDGYLFLARLEVSMSLDADAVATLEEARAHVPESAAMREGLGTYELSLNRLPEAITEFQRALAIDHAMPAARFGLGVAFRRSGRYDEALASFEELSRIDPGHPGLALERGLLFEARGESDRAVEYYQQALSESPDDPELLLRLGAAQVGAGEYDAAEETLRRVTDALPASAEAEHFVGRVAFARGNYAAAVTHFERAIDLDASRAEFWVYRAWAALEIRDLGHAREAAEAAIARDPSLGDAYWIRGAVRRASGMTRDALTDLNRALELRPNRWEALAEIGDAQDELRNLPAAIDAYQRATAAAPDNAYWWFRLGRLHLDADHAQEGARALVRATELGDAMAEAPTWLVDAHREAGDALRLTRDRAGAISHYRRYLELAPAGSVDADEVHAALRSLGAED